MSRQKISISISSELLKQLDRLANYEFASRSAIVRQALLYYARQPELQIIADPESVGFEEMYKFIKDDFPYVRKQDRGLVQVFYKLKIKDLGRQKEPPA